MSCDKFNWKDTEIRKNPFFCPDKKSVKLWEKYLLAVRKAGSSCGAVIELRASGIPVGLGAPIYSKLDTDCLLYTSPSPRDATLSRMPSSA